MGNELGYKGRALLALKEMRKEAIEKISCTDTAEVLKILKDEVAVLKRVSERLEKMSSDNMMDAYQRLTSTTAVYPKERALEYTSLGLVGEAGEICNKVKKVIRDNGGVLGHEKLDDLRSELGDVLWYVAQLATTLNTRLSDVANFNLRKLADRKKRGVLQGSGDNR
jgi:NTP pyrophosphatase (non-canonical NTP hydrolase)